MKTLFLAVLVSMFAVSSFAQHMTINDNNAVKRDVGGFHAIRVSSAIDIFLSQGDEEGVAVSASDPRYRDNIKTEVKDGVLNIWYMNVGHGFSMSGHKKLRAYISFKKLDKLEAAGASDVLVTGVIKSGSLEVRLSGASDFKGMIEVGSLRVNMSGASDMTVRGVVDAVNIDASGASDFKGFDLVTQTCDVTASGASDIKITCDKELNATTSGASDVHIRGNGVIRNMRSRGASSVKKV